MDAWNIGMLPLQKSAAYDFRDKTAAKNQLMQYQILRCLNMFKWKGLPDTLPEYMLELLLQGNGNCIITEGKLLGEKGLVAYTGAPDETYDMYYRNTHYNVSNPWAEVEDQRSKDYVIGKDCILARNDSLMVGLLPMHARYAQLMVENELSMSMAIMLLRAMAAITANTDADKLAADDFIKDLISGEFKSIKSTSIMEAIKTQPLFGGTGMNGLSQLIETEQYIKAAWCNEIGLDANYNMKRESLSMSESQMNDDALMPLPDDMLRHRKKLCEDVKKKYGVDWSVEFNSSWKANNEQIKQVTEQDPAGKEVKDEPEKTD